MKNETKLVKKVKCLLRRLGCPRWLHHFGPKKYEFLHHLCALLTRHFCRLSYRRIKYLFDLIGFVCPSKSALQYTSAKLNCDFWQRVLRITSGNSYVVAIDSTGFSRNSPSYHYLKRINGALPKIPVKLSVAFDTQKKKFCSAKIRVLPAHDSKDAKFLLQQTKHKVAVADKAYNSEKLFQLASEQGTILMVPEKSNAKRGFFRKKMKEKFRLRTYHRREMVESGNSSIKRKFGSSVSSKKARTIRSELYGRLACHNIFSSILRLLGQSRSIPFLRHTL